MLLDVIRGSISFEAHGPVWPAVLHREACFTDGGAFGMDLHSTEVLAASVAGVYSDIGIGDGKDARLIGSRQRVEDVLNDLHDFAIVRPGRLCDVHVHSLLPRDHCEGRSSDATCDCAMRHLLEPDL